MLKLSQLCWLVAFVGCSESLGPGVEVGDGSNGGAGQDSRDPYDGSSIEQAGEAIIGRNDAGTGIAGCVNNCAAGTASTAGAAANAGAVSIGGGGAPGGSTAPQTASGGRVDLQVLVISAGETGTSMVKAGLIEGLVPFTEVDLKNPNRPAITDAFLSDTIAPSTRRAKFQAVVMPNEAPSEVINEQIKPLMTAEELDALARFEREFKIRQFSGYVYPSASVGLNAPTNPGYVGPLDGFTASVTNAGKSGAFAYLNGSVNFEDIDPTVSESYGYLTTPLPDDPANKRSFTPLVTLPIPNSGNTPGVLLGVYTDNGREQLVMTGSMNQYQFQQQALFPGILNWLTYGVHIGTERNYFSVQIDDVFLPDGRWNTANNCTMGGDCDSSVTGTTILMTEEDVDFLIDWQKEKGMKLDLAFCGTGYDEAAAEGPYPLGDYLIASGSSFRWVNHTYGHEYLGCVRDFTVSPFRCTTDANGAVQWASYQVIYDQIHQNQDFAAAHGLPIAKEELVTGEHSGLRFAPQEPSDNPNLASALTATGIKWIGADNSRESVQRSIGSALTSPRYPMSIFYNTATKMEAVDEYNYIYTTAANGGSGLCENNPTSTCIPPLDPATGFDSYIVPINARMAMLHVLSNSPRAHFAHQSNLAEDRILYPVLNKVLADYNSTFETTKAPVVNASLTELGQELMKQTDWSKKSSNVSAYVQGGQLTLSVSGKSAINIPLTVPNGTAKGGKAFLGAYGGYRTGWSSTEVSGQTLVLPGSVGYAR
jgi:hypothetical protein